MSIHFASNATIKMPEQCPGDIIATNSVNCDVLDPEGN